MHKYRKVIFTLLFFTFFLASISASSIVANPEDWYRWEGFPCEESRIVRTMVLKDKQGLFARGGFVSDPYYLNECYRNEEDYRELQKKGWKYIKNYLQERPPYISSPGLDTIILYPFWRISQRLAKNSENRYLVGLKAMQAAAAAQTAIVITLLCLWIARETSIAAALGVAGALLLSSTNTIYALGHHAMLKPAMLLVPFLAIAFAMQSKWRVNMQKNSKKPRANTAMAIVAVIAATAICAKILFGWGYDMLAPTMITATIPIFWYAVKEKWLIKKFCLWFTASSLAILVGFVCAFALHYWQAKNIGKDFLAHAQHRVNQRVGLDKSQTDCRSITNKVVLQHYINKAAERILGKAIDKEKMLVGEEWQTLKICSSRLEILLIALPSQALMAIVVVPIIILARRKKYWREYSQKENPQAKRIEKAIVVAIVIAMLAAVSQPLTLKEATAIHSWWGPLAWEMMFRPLLFLLLAFTIMPSVKKYYAKFIARK